MLYTGEDNLAVSHACRTQDKTFHATLCIGCDAAIKPLTRDNTKSDTASFSEPRAVRHSKRNNQNSGTSR